MWNFGYVSSNAVALLHSVTNNPGSHADNAHAKAKGDLPYVHTKTNAIKLITVPTDDLYTILEPIMWRFPIPYVHTVVVMFAMLMLRL